MYFSLLMDIEHGYTASIIITAMIIFLQYFVLVILLSLMAVLSGALYYKYSELLANFSASIENMHCLVPQYRAIFKLLQGYNQLYKMMDEIETTFSSTCFLVLCSQWLNLYHVLVAYFKMENKGFSTAVSWECVARLILGLLNSVLSCVRQKSRLIFNALKQVWSLFTVS